MHSNDKIAVHDVFLETVWVWFVEFVIAYFFDLRGAQTGV